MMRNDEIKSLIKKQEPTFLSLAKHKGYVCPVCNNGKSGGDGDGIMRTPGSDSFHCFKCGMTDDVIGLIGKHFDIADFGEQMNKAKDYYGIIDGSVTKTHEAKKAEVVQRDEPDEEVDHMLDFKKWNNALNSSANPGLSYMEARGLSINTLNAFLVGFASEWKHPKTKHLPKVPSSPRVIIPTSPTSYLARDPRDPIPDSAKKYAKSKVGRVHIFNKKALVRSEDVVFIVEGEIDAMSIHELGLHALGLGSASNKRALVTLIKEHKPKATLIFLPDNDEAGQKSAKESVEELAEIGVKAYIANIFGKYKDANEMLVKDREALKNSLEDLKKRATATPSNTAPLSEVDHACRTLLKHLNLHERHRSYLKELGLTDEQIEKNCYRSAPSDPVSVCKNVKRSGCATDRNPMFATKDGELTLNTIASGILVPERNTKGQFQGFEYVSDRKSRELHHAHFRRGERCISEAVVTDSALKADVIAALSGYSTLALPAGCPEGLMKAALSSIQKRGLKKVLVAYDLWQNATTIISDKEKLRNAIKALGLSAQGMQIVRGMELDEFLLSNMKKKG